MSWYSLVIGTLSVRLRRQMIGWGMVTPGKRPVLSSCCRCISTAVWRRKREKSLNGLTPRYPYTNTITQIDTQTHMIRFVMHRCGVGDSGNAVRHAYSWLHEQHCEHHASVVCTSTQWLQPARLWVIHTGLPLQFMCHLLFTPVYCRIKGNLEGFLLLNHYKVFLLNFLVLKTIVYECYWSLYVNFKQ